MKYTLEKIKKMIDEVVKNSTSELGIPNKFIRLYRNDSDFKEAVDTLTFGDTFKQRLYNIYHGIKDWPKCKNPECDKKVEFRYFNTGYRETCSKYCTNILKYGCKSVFGTKWQHEKMKKTLLERTGYDCSMKNPETKAKVVKTMIERYGDIFQKTAEYKEKCQKTSLERYGAKHFMSTLEGLKKSQEAMKKKNNGKLYSQTEEFKKYASDAMTEDKKAKMAKGQRDSYYKKLENFAKNSNFKLLFSIDEYKSFSDENGSKRKYKFKCCSCGYEFETILCNFKRDGIICPHCGKTGKSVVQHKLLESLKSQYNGLTFIEDNNRILEGRKEIDIYCEEKKFGIEYNGNCWHAQKFNNKGKEYHFEKFKQFEKHNIDVLSFWSDEFDKKKDQIYEIIDLFLNEKYNQEISDNISYEFTNKLDDTIEEKTKHKWFYEISANDTFIVVKADDDAIAVLKCKDSIVNDIVFLRRYDFKKTFDSFNGRLMFKLDNRLIAYYRLFFNDKIKFISYEEPRFYLLSKGKRRMLKSDILKVDFSKEDVIWNYGESIYQLN